MSNYYGNPSSGFYGSHDGGHLQQQQQQQQQPSYGQPSGSAAPWGQQQPSSSSSSPYPPRSQQQQQHLSSSHQPQQGESASASSSGSYNDHQQWRQPSQQQQQQSSQQSSSSSSFPYGSPATATGASQPAPAAGAATASFWNPATAATMAAMAGSLASATGAGGGGGRGMVDAGTMLDLASTAGKTFLQSGTARMIPGLEATMQVLRRYFAVDNQYVVKKMKRLFFPFLSRSWQRSGKDVTGVDSSGNPTFYYAHDLPVHDENAPDLYLPTMSLITYVLLCALIYGTAGKFNPEVIPDVTTRCFATQILEVLLIRFGFYAMQAPVAILDLFSYTGYKYVGLCLNVLVALLVGHFGLGVTGYYVAFCWTASAASYFMLKTMANNIPGVTAATGPKREVMVLAFAVSQFATMWFVSQTKFL